MARLDDQRRVLATSILHSRAIETELTPSQARLFVRSLQISWQVPPIAWAPRESHEQYADARRLFHAAQVFVDVDGSDSPGATSCYRRSAELLEWMSRSSDAVTRDVPASLLAAGAYQLAGLPAMATSLLRQGRYGGGIAEIIGAYLSADFERVLARVVTFWSDHFELTSRTGSQELLAVLSLDFTAADEPADEPNEMNQNEGQQEQLLAETGLGWYVTVELVRCLGLLSDSIRRGNDRRLAQAMRKLQALNDLATRLATDEFWILISLLTASSQQFAQRSLHTRVTRLANNSPELMPRMQRFAREQFARGRGILWTSQVQGLERLITTRSFALCTPTGSGKTLVANLALVKELLLAGPFDPAPIALYLVPSRALANEVETKLTAELGKDVIVTGLYGGADWGITDYWLTADQPVVLIATVEKGEALMRYVGHLLLHRLRLLILDEAHQVVNDGDTYAKEALAAHTSRSMRLEALVSRIFVAKPDIARIALTAVAGGAAEPVAKWIEGRNDAAPIGIRYRSSRQLIGALECDPQRPPRATLDMLNGQPLYVRGRDLPVYLPLRIPRMELPAAPIRNSLPHYAQLYTLWTALHTLDGNRRVLISVMQSPEVIMKRFAEAFTLSGWETVWRFTPPEARTDLVAYEEARQTCTDYCGHDSYELALLNRGIATSHGQMPQRLRRLMTRLVERRICPVTVATATLTEGVNLPFDIIFLNNIVRRRFDATTGTSTTVPMSTSEFNNLAGRAGRPGSADSIEGITLVVVPQRQSTTARTQRENQLNQVQAANSQFNGLLRRLREEGNAPAVVLSPLAVLLRSIREKTLALGLRTEEEFEAWLENTLPENAGGNLGVESKAVADQLGDSLDELDGFILSAVEECTLMNNIALDGARAEEYLRDLWRHTFTRVSTTLEEWLERSFIHRGRAFVDRLYPNAPQRRRLYQYGFTPYIGRRFELVAPQLILELQGATAYGTHSPEERFQVFLRLGERMRAEPGIGFRIRNTVGDQNVLARWNAVLGWWLQRPGAAPPPPGDLRDWQRFVAENLEFKLGAAVGAAVAQAWGQNAEGQQTPTLQMWRETTQLPWFGFWIRELLKWGTLDPFVAFCMAQGLAGTRSEATAQRPSFDGWLEFTGLQIADEDLIDPRNFLAWQKTLILGPERPEGSRSSEAHPTNSDGRRGIYDVLPVRRGDSVDWIDAGGYALARSGLNQGLLTERPERHDFTLTTGMASEVTRAF
ncbi:MAG: DEAD/DEAH box helicase [Puia sp.]|nr:DEAD/DEAH box helicase [Puia sp.]